MPRFDNEGFNPEKRIQNDRLDRSVPADENYYGGDFDLFPVTSSARRAQQRQEDTAIEPARDNGEERRRYREEREAKRNEQAKKKKQKKKTIIAVIAAVLVLLLILIPTFMVEGVLGKIHYDDKKENQYAAAAELKSDPDVKNILLLGVDARAKDKPETSRPDSIMLVTIDRKHSCIKMTSFLRDTWVFIPARDTDQRINTGTNPDGYSGMVDTIEYNFGVDIDGYVVTNFKMFRKMVDSIGGVVIDVTEKEAEEVTSHPKRYGKVKLKAGKHRLNGKQALAYARIRKIDTDFVRAQRQRTVLNSILSEAKKNPLKLYSLANACAPYLETDLSKSELKKIGAMAALCMSNDMPQDKIPYEGTWKYANIGGASVIAIDKDKNRELLAENLYNKSAEELMQKEE